MDINGKFEIVITVKKSRYKATSPAFPNCKGFGNTEKEAIEKLTKSISKHISGITENMLNKVLLSDTYTEIVLDSSKNNHEERRVFNLDQLQFAIQNVDIKSKTPFDPILKHPKFTERDIKDLLPSLSQDMDIFDANNYMPYSNVNSQNNYHDGILFGFSVSLN
jgi:predicted RNase H-like HicB family nuclease